MAKYRIKKQTKRNGDMVYIAQKKDCWIENYRSILIYSVGGEDVEYDSRDEALEVIKEYRGNEVIKTEYENINDII